MSHRCNHQPYILNNNLCNICFPPIQLIKGQKGPRGPPGPPGPPGPGFDISGLPENAILWVENDVIKGNPCMTFDTSDCTINISGGIVFEPNISNPNSGIFSGSTLWVDSSGCLNLGTQNLCMGATGPT